METADTILYNKVLDDLIVKYPKVRKSELKSMVVEYFRNINRILTYGNKVNDITYAKKIRLPFLGSFNFNYNVLRKVTEGKLNRYLDIEYYKSVNTLLYLAGWQLLKWTKRKGYTFYNDISGEEYNLLKEHIQGKRQAVVYFYNYLTDNEKQNIIDELNYEGKLYKCNMEKEILEIVVNYDDLNIKYEVQATRILKSIIFNGKKPQKSNSMKIGSFVWMKEIDYEKKDIIRDVNKTYKHAYKIDIVSKETNEIIHKEYGTVKDCSEFVRVLGKYHNPNPSNIIKHLDKGTSIYGYKWKKS
jgi:hypothetical protein